MMREVKIENKPQIAGIERQLFFFLFCLGPANATLMDYRRIRVLLVESFASTGSLNLRFKTSRSKRIPVAHVLPTEVVCLICKHKADMQSAALDALMLH